METSKMKISSSGKLALVMNSFYISEKNNQYDYGAREYDEALEDNNDILGDDERVGSEEEEDGEDLIENMEQ